MTDMNENERQKEQLEANEELLSQQSSAIPAAEAEDMSTKKFEEPPSNGPLGSLALSIDGTPEEQQAPALLHPVVGFGASAGGLQAFREILENLDPHTGMAFVLVTHLSPDQKSLLTEIVNHYTPMPVLPIEEGQSPQPDHIYVLQPNQILTLREGVFRTENRTGEDRIPRTIDKFFRSLAVDQKNHAIGVILSGADSDGALGLKAIKGEGGIALVQSPSTALHEVMPRTSIAADHVDLVIPPKELAHELGRLAHQFTRPALRSLEVGHSSREDENSFQKILALLRSSSGLDLRQYKPETIRRRIARRMILLRIDQLLDYHRFLQTRTDELRALQEDVLISVTRFFRDSAFWESLQSNVLPVLLQDRSPEKPIRVWCAGCSTGEEVYSLAITILEYLSQNGLDTPLQIFGTDASDQSIESARIAVYPDTLTGEISPERLRRYFVKVDRGYQVSKRVRDTCIFAKQNLCNDPPFSHIDILSCRNVMIYFNQTLQRQVLLTFHYALDPGGYLLLGMSERLRDYGDVFSTIDSKHKIYSKTGANLPFSYDPPQNYSLTRGKNIVDVSTAEVENNIWPELELQRAADRIVLARFGPPGLIIDERMNVLQARGQTSPFIEITPGAVNWNLLRLLREGLTNEVRTAVQHSIGENIPASATAILLSEEKGEQHVQIDVLPITSASARPRCYLILFQFITQGAPIKSQDHPTLPMLTLDEKERLIAQLRQDLSATRFHLQSLVEERDARNQELVSANEEIQSANEELQSTNEELETTKEELQSANEELQTVNDELQQRNNILTQTGNDLTNLLNSVNIPLLMLTSDLHIRQFTPPMQRLLSVRPADIGRSISEIRLQLSIENIEPILSEVLETLGTREVEVQDREGRWHLLRVRPYRTADNKIEGLVVLLIDIDLLRKSQQQLVDTRDFVSAVLESVPGAIIVLNSDCTIRTVNTAFRSLTQMQVRELEGRSFPDLVSHLWGLTSIRKKLTDLLKAEPGALMEMEHESTTLQKKILYIKAIAVSTDGNRVLLLLIDDITSHREAERQIAKQKEELESEVAIAARRLNRTQEELRGLTAHLFNVQEEERQRIARDLHDDICQRLSVMELFFQGIRKNLYAEEAQEQLANLQAQLQTLNTDIRELSHNLHPAILNDLGLSAALKSLVEEFGQREEMPVTYLSRNLPEKLPAQIAIAVYRIAQEALRNISKHAGKTHVKISLESRENLLELRVMDFGMGFDQESDLPSSGLGMISMQERARFAGGKLEVHSSLGEGTTVTAEIPLE